MFGPGGKDYTVKNVKRFLDAVFCLWDNDKCGDMFFDIVNDVGTQHVYGKGFLEARRPPKVSNEMKCTNETMTWNTQNTNLS